LARRYFARMMTNPTRGTDIDDLTFCFSFAISRSMLLPKSHRKIDLTEPVAREIVEHLSRCNYVVTKGPVTKPHGSFKPGN
jgi:hypothetical protein